MSERLVEITVRGEVPGLEAELDGVNLVVIDNGLTHLRVVVRDASALYANLDRLEDRGLELLGLHHLLKGEDASPDFFVRSRTSSSNATAADDTEINGGSAMSIGPVEYVIIGFPGNKFNGSIAPELAKLAESGTIRILDLVFVTKDAAGNVDSLEYEDHDDVALFAALEGDVGGLISESDIEYAGATLEPNSSAALLIWEDLWAKPFADALRSSGAVLLEGARVPYELIEAAEHVLASTGG